MENKSAPSEIGSEKNQTITDQPTERPSANHAAASVLFPLADSEMRTWTERLEFGSKLVLLIVGLTYVIGFLILNIYTIGLGAGNFGILRPEYIIVGALWLFLVTVTYGAYVAAKKFDQILNGEALKVGRRSALYIAILISTPITICMSYFIPALPVSLLSSGSLISVSTFGIVLGLWFTLLTIYFAKILVAEALIYFKRPYGKDDQLHSLKVLGFAELPTRLLLVLIAITIYANAIFPLLESEYGGGKPKAVQMFIQAQNVQAMKEAGFAFPSGNRSLGTVELVLESPDFFLIKPPDGFDKGIRMVRVEKDLVDVVFYQAK